MRIIITENKIYEVISKWLSYMGISMFGIPPFMWYPENFRL